MGVVRANTQQLAEFQVTHKDLVSIIHWCETIAAISILY